MSVDEEGTEAAAATGVITEKVVSGRPDPKKVMVDRPFIFLIRDRATDAILFVGAWRTRWGRADSAKDSSIQLPTGRAGVQN